MELSDVAAQLRKPEGKDGLKIAEAMNKSNPLINRAAIEMLSVNDCDNVLEIGMGNGLFVGELMKLAKSISYTGVDYSKLMIEHAKIINSELSQRNRVNFIHADASDLPFPNSTFDKVFCVNVIYFWKNPERKLAEINRVMKSDAVFAIAIRSKESMKLLPFTVYGFETYTMEELNDLLRNNGFIIKDKLIQQEPDQQKDGVKYSLENLVVSYTKK